MLSSLALLCVHVASSSPLAPTVITESDGTVVARASLPASEPEVRAVLSDATRAIQLSDDVLSASAKAMGECTELSVMTKGGLTPMHYRALRCPTEDGWEMSLLESEDLSHLRMEWKLAASDESKTLIEYRLRINVKGFAPDALVQRGVRRTGMQTLKELIRRLISA